MNKKLCILINGSTRIPVDVIINCIDSYKNIFKDFEYDIWFFTWKTEDNRELQFKPHVYKLINNFDCPTDIELNKLGIPYTAQLIKDPQHKVCRISHYSTMFGLGYLFNEIINTNHVYEYAFRARNDIELSINNIDSWFKALELDANTYITPTMKWCPIGINDHIGLGKFEVVKNIWSWDEEHFKKTIPNCWNFEVYMKERLTLFGYKYVQNSVDKYIIKRTGRTFNNGAQIPDWNLT